MTEQIRENDASIAQIRQSIFALNRDVEVTTVSLRARVSEIVDRAGSQDDRGPQPQVTFLGPVDLMADAALTDDVTAVVTDALANVLRCSRLGAGRRRHRHRRGHRRGHRICRRHLGQRRPTVGVVSHPTVTGDLPQDEAKPVWWAAGYDLLSVPLAAGVLAPVGFVLPMSVGAILMSASTIIVALNAHLLSRLDLGARASTRLILK